VKTIDVQVLPIRLQASRRKWAVMLVLSLAFVSGGVWIAPRDPFVGYSCIAFFGMGAAMAAVTLHPNSTYLILDSKGFTFSTLFRKAFFPWSQVQIFLPVRVALNQMVGWNFTSDYWKMQTLRKVNTAISGAEAALPDTYGVPVKDLVRVMNSLREEYGSTAL
jgi:hypothetical protein